MDKNRFDSLQYSIIFRFFDRLILLVKLNLIMLLFTIFGVVLFGFYPSIFAATEIANCGLEYRESNLFKKFTKAYGEMFLRGNLLMVITAGTLFLGYLLLFGDLVTLPIILSTFIYFFYLLWVLVVLMWNLYLPSLSVLYPEYKLKKCFKFCIILGCSKYKLTIKIILLIGIWVVGSHLVPQLAMFVVLSVLPWFIQWLVKKTLKPETLNKIQTDEL